MRASLIPGAGVVLRTSTLLCVAGESCAANLLPRITALVERLAPGESAPTRVVEDLAAELVTFGRPVDLAVAVPGDNVIAVYLAGAVFAEADGSRLTPEPDGPFDGVIGRPDEGLGLYLAGVIPDEPGQERFDLRIGRVPAAGVLLHVPTGAGGAHPRTAAMPAEPGADTNPSTLSDVADPGSLAEPSESPVETAGSPTQPAAPPVVTVVLDTPRLRPKVRGIRCQRGHLNPPQAWLCAVCGGRMDQVSATVVDGERSPLGWLIFDNGTTQLLDGDVVLGREPEPTDVRRPGGPTPVRVDDATGQSSRRHLELRLVDWTVQAIDLGSANGTYVTPPHAGGREYRLVPHRAQPLLPGSRVRLGGRYFLFESPHPPS